MFADKGKKPILNVRGALLGCAPAFTLNHESKLKRPKRDKHSSLFGPSANYGLESFFLIGLFLIRLFYLIQQRRDPGSNVIKLFCVVLMSQP
jgi:hypothetical protein